MRARAWLALSVGLTVTAPALAPAQAPSPASGPTMNQVGGRSTVDLVMLRPGSRGVPLRHGAVVPGSERVQLDGRALQRGTEYSIDNEAGVIYLMVAAKPGQAVTASYRYDPAKGAQSAETAFGGVRPFQFNIGGSLGMMMGLGLTERTAEGQVLTSNVFGFNNSFGFGSSSLSGLYLVGERTQEHTESAYEYVAPGAKPDEGRSQLILQSLQTRLGGGTLQLDYQDVSKNFTALSSVRAAGYDQGMVDQLARERGLIRKGASLQGVNLGSLGFSGGYRTVGDDKGGVTWRSFGIDSGSLKMNWRSQEVDQDFQRFRDLAEADREQLMREAGLRRENWDGSWASGVGLLSFNSFLVEDGEGKGIRREELKLDGKAFKFLMGEQEVETGFTRFDSLFEQEKGQWGRETGLRRQWKSLEAALFGAAGQPLRYSTHRIESATGDFGSVDASVGGKTWSLEHIGRTVDQGFAALPSLTQAELDGHVNAVSSMYVKGGLPFRPEERHWILQSAGISRELTRLSLIPLANWNLSFEQLRLAGKADEAAVDTYTLTAKGLSASYRRQDLGKDFTELANLLELERQRLGTMAGVERIDMALQADLKGGARLEYAQTDANTPTGGMNRQSFKYNDRQIQASVNVREVDPTFTNVTQLLDAEAGLLGGMVGFKQTDAFLKWQLLPSLKVEAMAFWGESDELGQDRAMSNVLVAWAPDPLTALEYSRYEMRSEDAVSTLFANSVERMSVSRNLGRYGTLRLAQQMVDYDGRLTSQPDSAQTALAYEARLNDKTSVKTEQIRTRFDNGDKEDVSANTISTEIGKSMGLSYTDVRVDRRGGERDENKRNVGFWVNLWGGVRLNVGMNDQLNHQGSSTGQHTVTLTPGTIGNLQVVSASYNANSWEAGDRVQAMSNVGLSTAKPFRLGFLENVKLAFGHDTAADGGRWLKENRQFTFSGSVGKNQLGYEYRGQMDHLEQRGVDRTFTLTTDQSEKSPLRATAMYKLRTLPGDKTVAVRNFSVVAKPVKGMELTHQLLTNPELPRGDVLLGSVPQPVRVNKWKLDYTQSKDLKLSGSWEEQRNDDTHALSRIGGVSVTLFEGKGSPLSLFYGVEQVDGNVPKRTIDRWSLRYDQKPGPNQVFSLFVGNVTYGHTLLPNEKRDNLSAQLEYQLKF